MGTAQLIVQRDDEFDSYELDGKPFSIGRHPGNRLCINDDRMSRRHCVVEPGAAGFEVVDLGSRNGVRVNGQRVTGRLALNDGDILKVGGTVMQFRGSTQPSDTKDADQTVANAIASAHASTFEDELESGLEPIEPLKSDPLDEDELIGHVASPQAGQAFESGPSDLNLEMALRELSRISEALDPPPCQASKLALHSARDRPVGEAGEAADAGLQLMRLVLLLCIQTRATDVHLEPGDQQYALRFRADGVMVSMAKFDGRVGRRLMNVSKILCELDITQKAMIQEGHFTARLPAGRSIDYRVSITPVMRGQKLVIRVLDLANAPARIRDLQAPRWITNTIRKTIGRDAGMVLAAGPTGSGKTTTLYAIIREINASQRNIITIEDPVEYQIEGVTQIPIDVDQGNTFTTLLRAVLRQDPDVILLGEIRDAESAQIAMQAAVTGHLVLATIHAKDVIGALYRLMDLGVDNQLLASAVNVVIAQRLVRRLCPHCKRKSRPSASQRLSLGDAARDVTVVHEPNGCVRCLKTGYRGRLGVFEMMEANADLRDALITNPSTHQLRKALGTSMFHTLRENAFGLVTSGETSLEEVARVAGGD